jgi:predicted TIM-barrel fold metal-dependent hydrolase
MGRHSSRRRIAHTLSALALSCVSITASAQQRLPIIDMHLHAMGANDQGPPPLGLCTPINPMPAWDPAHPYTDAFMALLKKPPCPDPVWSPMTDQELMQQTLAVMDRLNVIGVVSGDAAERVARWREAGRDRLIPALALSIDKRTPNPDSLRRLHGHGDLAVLGEIGIQYQGIAPDDERMAPYWALADELDIPVGIHIGTGPPGAIYLGYPRYRGRLHSAFTMEEVLVRHPRLRVYLMHAGYPLLDDLLAVLYAHPQVYVDVGVIVWTQPRAVFNRYLQGIVDAGFGNRVMFGSDQMVWPGAIERSVAVIEEAPFLSAEQKRDILYNNAARFLRLSPEEIARHHALGGATRPSSPRP